LAVLGRLERQTRAEVARAIVGASVGLYPGRPEDVATPWPTKRAPREVLEDHYAQRAWDTLQAAEQSFREQRGLAMGRER
ncbi:MAG TPA: hypothetical protein VFJ16_26365, partial [Longimicrobium sp.]|nr:hypothetical protein [Longimicrobium sp.]